MGRLGKRLSRLPGLSRPQPPDPFRTLELQDRLSRLSCELVSLGAGGDQEFARGFHATAALMAYDRTLDEACQLAGLPVVDGAGPTHRILAEAALSQAGWTW
jgi:hypothetical protein